MIHAEKRRKAENPRKSPKKSYAEKRRKAENPRNREKAPVLRALGERKKGAREAEIRPLPYL